MSELAHGHFGKRSTGFDRPVLSQAEGLSPNGGQVRRVPDF
jgi:hypothetical protein